MTQERMVRIEYYAKIREAMGRASEDIALPGEVGTAGALIDWLVERDAAGRAALDQTVHIALDDVMAQAATPLDGVATIALFPPMTGG